MSIECGTVVEKRGDFVLVRAAPNSACASCGAKESCFFNDSDKTRNILIRNTISAVTGDDVEFHIREKTVVGISVLLYFVPVIFLLAGIVTGIVFHGQIGMDRDLAAATGGISGLVISFGLIRLMSKRLQERRDFHPELLRIINVDGGEKNNKNDPS